jgi:aminoglycoside phosphotransferase (APT) family kinase protein
LTANSSVPNAIRDLARRIFAPGPIQSIERMTQGISTYVFQIRTDAEVFYLRVWPEAGESFAPEARVHELLRRGGVRVPDVVHLEDCNDTLERSVMVTTEIPGEPLSQGVTSHELRAVLLEAGSDLAIINSIEVDGFGWVERGPGTTKRLRAELPTHHDFVVEHLDSDLDALRRTPLAPAILADIRDVVDARWATAPVIQGYLAHGDFDLTHIYHQKGRYTGIIDFGEIRGAERIYDLAHFNVHDGEVIPYLGLAHLLDGYRQQTFLPPDFEEEIHLSSLLIAVRTLGRTLDRPMQDLHQLCLQVIRRELSTL